MSYISDNWEKWVAEDRAALEDYRERVRRAQRGEKEPKASSRKGPTTFSELGVDGRPDSHYGR